MTAIHDEKGRLLRIGNPALSSEERPLGCSSNYACNDAQSVIRRAVLEARRAPGSFCIAAWGRINLKLISPVGLIFFRPEHDHVWFSFFNTGNLDGPISREAPDDWPELVCDRLQSGEYDPARRESASILFPIHRSNLDESGDLDELIERMTGCIFS